LAYCSPPNLTNHKAMTKKLPDADSKATISGEIRKIKYRSSEGWAVFDLEQHPFGLTGILPEMCQEGTTVTCTGTWENSRYGRQLKCSSVIPAKPDISDAAGVIRLLQRLPGIGPRKAELAVGDFGAEEAWRLASENPEKIGVKQEHVDEARRIAGTLIDSYEATVYLLSIGLTDHQAGKIYREYSKDAVQIVRENPYQLTEIDGFGFITVDKVALKAGMGVGNPARISACVLYVLDDGAAATGHIYHNGWALADLVLETLTETAMKAEVPLKDMPGKEEVRRVVHGLAHEGKVVLRKGNVFSKRLIEAEERILGFMGAR
jgi:exodeoxyribonuclease V alpha subunit